MSIEDELQRLAVEREDAFESALDELGLDPPDFLLRQMRAYLADQEDHARIKRFAEKSVQLRQQTDGIQELECHAVLHLPPTRKAIMVRVHLTLMRTPDALIVPRCNLHMRRQQGPCTLPDREPTPDLTACL